MHLIGIQLAEPPGESQGVADGERHLAQLGHSGTHALASHGSCRLVHGEDLDANARRPEAIDQGTVGRQDDQHLPPSSETRCQSGQGKLPARQHGGVPEEHGERSGPIEHLVIERLVSPGHLGPPMRLGMSATRLSRSALTDASSLEGRRERGHISRRHEVSARQTLERVAQALEI